MFTTIKSKFIVLSIGLIILSVGIPVWVLLSQVGQNFHDRSVLMIEATIDLMIEGLNESMMIGDQKNIQHIVGQVSNKSGIEHVRIFGEDGSIKYSDNPEEIGEIINAIQPGHIEGNITDIKDREVHLDKSTNVYKVVQPLLPEERCQSCHKENKIISYLDVDTDFTKAEMTYYTGSLHMFFLGGALIFLLAYGFYILFSKFINKPLNDFTLALESVQSGDLKIRLSEEGEDEFSKLNHHFNTMVKELKDSRDKIDELHFEQLQRADKMVTLGELTASMAHDINNHSAIIMSRADYLLYEAEKENYPPQCKDDLEVINDQIEKISQITGNILKHSKKLSQSYTDVDVKKLVNNVSIMMLPLIKKQNVTLRTEFKVENPEIKGDPNQMEQVLLNLISNSLDALDEDGEIVVLVKNNDQQQLEIIVQDNGIGIDDESMSKIFSPFYTNKSFDKGTGLGLYIVQNICKNHNASIICESELNKGTKFTITFNGVKND